MFSYPDKALTRWTVHAQNDREFLGMPPTNREVHFTGVTVSYFSHIGQGVAGAGTGLPEVTQEFHYWDMVALLQQIQAPAAQALGNEHSLTQEQRLVAVAAGRRAGR